MFHLSRACGTVDFDCASMVADCDAVLQERPASRAPVPHLPFISVHSDHAVRCLINPLQTYQRHWRSRTFSSDKGRSFLFDHSDDRRHHGLCFSRIHNDHRHHRRHDDHGAYLPHDTPFGREDRNPVSAAPAVEQDHLAGAKIFVIQERQARFPALRSPPRIPSVFPVRRDPAIPPCIRGRYRASRAFLNFSHGLITNRAFHNILYLS